jgi:hypothetical protein
VLGIILIALSVILTEVVRQPGQTPSRLLFYGPFLGGLALIFIANRWRIGMGRPGQGRTSGNVMRGRSKLVLILLLGGVIVVQLVYVYYLGEQSAPFSMQVTPQHVENGVAGQSYVFSVTVQEEGEGRHQGEAIKISVLAPDATTSVDPEIIAPGEVAYVTVIPDEASVGSNLTAIIYGRRSKRHKVKVTIMVNAP